MTSRAPGNSGAMVNTFTVPREASHIFSKSGRLGWLQIGRGMNARAHVADKRTFQMNTHRPGAQLLTFSGPFNRLPEVIKSLQGPVHRSRDGRREITW